MKLTAKIKLTPTDEQRQLLHETLQRANAVCNYISDVIWEEKQFRRIPVHKLTYYTVREQFGLSAQVAVRAIGKVVDAYKLDKKTRRQFKKHGSFPYDDRILRYLLDDRMVSIWLLDGRETISFVAGQRQIELLKTRRGESDLMFIRGEFYLLATCDVETPEPEDVDDYMGVDLGIVNIATTDDGEHFSGKVVNRVRHRYDRIRRKLQKKGTKSAKRLLKKRSGKEYRFINDVNHCISKAIVKKAQRTERGIAIEALTGIRGRVRLRKSQRTQLHSWSFAQLGFYIHYKAELSGVSLVKVDPRNTSRMCSCCGHISKSNRSNQAAFKCTECDFSAHADVNAATNIGRRASVNTPYADSDLGANPA